MARRPVSLLAASCLLLSGCPALSGCTTRGPEGDPDVVYEITEVGSGAVWLRYLEAAQPGEDGKLRGAEAHKNAQPPFTAGVRLGEGWTHAWIEAKTEPVDQTVKLHCVLKHNGVVLTEGDGMGFVSCRAHSNGAPPPQPAPSA
ncbi:MAG: hypothetical protein ACRC20_15690 [Segniliparus sp.]|uniref:hypothetical protein n=1 Tax=Segniliparus sp. TaxID=2804064 RepID=UPI003F4169B8